MGESSHLLLSGDMHGASKQAFIQDAGQHNLLQAVYYRVGNTDRGDPDLGLV